MKRISSIEEKVKDLASPIVRESGIELVDVVYTSGHGRGVLRVFVDKPGGITLDDCSRVSRELGTSLDVEDIFPQSYVLEVSSPGIDKPLIKEEDFSDAVGKKIRLKTKKPIEGRKNFISTLEAIEGDGIIIRDSDGRHWRIELSNIDRAKLEVEF